MLTPVGPPRPDMGLGWMSLRAGLGWQSVSDGEEWFWGHGGGDFGASTAMHFRPSDGTGVIVLANGNYDGLPEVGAVERRLFEEAERF